MNTKLIGLYDKIQGYEESKELKKIILSYSYPLILKMAQEQLSLFEGITNQDPEEVTPTQPRTINYSFNSLVGNFGLDKEGAELLDQIAEKLLERYPEKLASDIIGELKKEFVSSYHSGYYGGYYSGAWISKNQDKLEKYLQMFPELKWQASEHQLSLPLKEIPATIPLGGTPKEVFEIEKEKSLAKKIKEEVSSKEEYRVLKDGYYEAIRNLGGTAEYNALNRRMKEELERRFAENNIPNKYLSDYYQKENFTYSADLIEGLKKELEEKWHKLKAINEKLVLEVNSLDPGDFSPKPIESISGYKDFVFSITEYATWASKKFIHDHVNYRPIFERWRSTRGIPGDIDLSDLKKLLELTTTSVDPVDDYRTKLRKLEEQEKYCESVNKYIVTWRSIFKKIDRNLLPKVEEAVNKLGPQDSRLLKWVSKFRPDIIKKSYDFYLSKIASNLSDEAEKFPINEDLERSLDLQSYGRPNVGIRSFDFSDLFLTRKTQSGLIDKLVQGLFGSLTVIGPHLMDEMIQKIGRHLFSIAKQKFEEKYFNIPVSIQGTEYRKVYIEEVVPVDKVRLFIQEWNGRPNLKSFENVILAATKDSNLVDNFYNSQFSDSLSMSEFFPDGKSIYGDILKFISKVKIGEEEEILRQAEVEVLPKLNELIMQFIATQIFTALYSTEFKMRASGYGYKNKRVTITSESWKPIAPTLFTQDYRTLVRSSGAESSDPKHSLKRICETLAQLAAYLYNDLLIDSTPKEAELSLMVNSLRDKIKESTYFDGGNKEYVEIINKYIDELTELARQKEVAKLRDTYNQESVDLLRSAVADILKVVKFSEFFESSKTVSLAFGGIGFKDISSGVDQMIAESNVSGISKKEFVQILSQYINSSFSNKSLPIEERENINYFLRSISGDTFKKFIFKIIGALNLRDTKQILSVSKKSYEISTSLNFNEKDLEKAIRAIPASNLTPDVAAERWIRAASFIHNHTTLPMNYVRNLVRSPNFYSNTSISQEFIQSCAKLYILGGVNELKKSDSKFGSIVQKLVDVELIPDKDIAIKKLNTFSRICANKDGIRPNIGNGTAEMKLNDYLEEKELGSVRDSTPDWNSMSFESKVNTIREYLKKEYIKWGDFSDEEVLLNLEKFDEAIKKILNSASTPEQYEKDMNIKQIILNASSLLKLIQESEAIMTYAKDAKKKDKRLFDFQWESPGHPVRFRVLKDLDPYHFDVGSDTNCCQRLDGQGEAAAIDSFVNPLAGVLLLEGKIDAEWRTLSQSYFHYVPNTNGVILDNVEYNYSNVNLANRKYSIDIDEYYAAFAQYIKEKNNLSYVRCGSDHNKLTNSSFQKSKLPNGDPRYFEYSRKYTDFKAHSHIDLLSPKFKIKINLDNKKAISIYSNIIKLASQFSEDTRFNIFDIYFDSIR